MKKLLIIALVLFLYGCVSGGPRITIDSDKLNKLDKTREIIVKVSYNEAFKAVINVFHDLTNTILQKDYENKVITGKLYARGLTNRFDVFFQAVGIQETKIIFRMSGPIMPSTPEQCRPGFILLKIEEEIALQRKFKE